MIKIEKSTVGVSEKQGEKEGVIFTFDSTSIKETVGLVNMGTGLITDPISFDQFLTEPHATAREINPGEKLTLHWSVPKGLHSFDLKYLEIDVASQPVGGLRILPTHEYFKLLQGQLKWSYGANGCVSLKLKGFNQNQPFIEVSKTKFNDLKDLPDLFISYGFVFSFKTTSGAKKYFGRIDPLVKISTGG